MLQAGIQMQIWTASYGLLPFLDRKYTQVGNLITSAVKQETTLLQSMHRQVLLPNGTQTRKVIFMCFPSLDGQYMWEEVFWGSGVKQGTKLLPLNPRQENPQ